MYQQLWLKPRRRRRRRKASKLSASCDVYLFMKENKVASKSPTFCSQILTHTHTHRKREREARRSDQDDDVRLASHCFQEALVAVDDRYILVLRCTDRDKHFLINLRHEVKNNNNEKTNE